MKWLLLASTIMLLGVAFFQHWYSSAEERRHESMMAEVLWIHANVMTNSPITAARDVLVERGFEGLLQSERGEPVELRKLFEAIPWGDYVGVRLNHNAGQVNRVDIAIYDVKSGVMVEPPVRIALPAARQR